jgi:SSS family solute:Na+ symporter
LEKTVLKGAKDKTVMRISQCITLTAGVLAVFIAVQFEKVLEAILYAYGFMVSGLFIPTLGAYFWKKSSRAGAFVSMIAGGGLFLSLKLDIIALPLSMSKYGINPSVFGLIISGVVFIVFSLMFADRKGSFQWIETKYKK